MPMINQSEVAAYCLIYGLSGGDGDFKKAGDKIIELAEKIKAEREACL